jgi:hypothetical protein
LKRAVHHGHLPSITPKVLRRFSVNGVFTTQILDVIRDNLNLTRRSGKHKVSFSAGEIAKLDSLIGERKLFAYTPKRPLALKDTDTKGGPTVNLECKSLEVAIRWYTEFLGGATEFDDKEKSVFSDEHVAEPDTDEFSADSDEQEAV